MELYLHWQGMVPITYYHGKNLKYYEIREKFFGKDISYGDQSKPNLFQLKKFNKIFFIETGSKNEKNHIHGSGQ